MMRKLMSFGIVLVSLATSLKVTASTHLLSEATMMTDDEITIHVTGQFKVNQTYQINHYIKNKDKLVVTSYTTDATDDDSLTITDDKSPFINRHLIERTHTPDIEVYPVLEDNIVPENLSLTNM